MNNVINDFNADTITMATAADTASQLQCSMCENLTEDLVTLSCEHTFCRSCLKQLTNVSDPQCPQCSQAPKREEMDDLSHYNTDERASGLIADTIMMATAADITSHLQCSMCKNLTEDLVTTSCGHTFCESCLNQRVNMSDPQCPQCHQAPKRAAMDDLSHINTGERASGLIADTITMATAADTASLLQCSMCKNLTEDLVTLSCEHTFCESCLNQLTNMSDPQCPQCHQAPKRVEMDDLSHFNTDERGEILCDICEENRRFIAVKSCLTCLLSYCEHHLKPHQSMEMLRGHKLVKPVKRLEERACSVHGRPLDLYSTRDKRCICALCVTPGENVITLETERKRREAEQQRTIVKLKSVIEKGENKIIDLKNTARNIVDEINREQTEIKQVFAAVMDAVKRAEEELIAPLEDRRRSLEREMEEKTQKIQEDLQEYKNIINHLNQTQNEEDDILFLQLYSSVPAEFRDDLRVSINTELNFGSMRNITTSVLTSMRTQLENLCSFEMRRIQTFLVDVILDKKTAHPALEVSQDGKAVRGKANAHDSPGVPKQFDLVAGVLGNLQIKSGKAFWLVEVGQITGWELGIVRENANRRGTVSYKPSEGYWVIVFCGPNTYGAYEDRPVQLHLSTKPQKVGVFVDYESDLVSFYDMDDQSHIYTFTQCRFNGTIRPYFNPHPNKNVKNSDPMIIFSVNPSM
ncbi:E3 ubiquitin-protein ligase TRIM21-like isoform X2 [Paramisgurnus dabryanus]|uniref:E3 ubiquitin-protein ligase TRIM21-like isoform X2 n=1 Tax=Paramisgurnus dabryanus TaxID=90735 RepID=UPI003CCFA4C9